MDARHRARAWLLPLLPALLVGAHLAGLLLFLNPHLPLSWTALARGTALFGAMFAPLSIVVHLGVARWRRVDVDRLLPWSTTVVVAAGALANWVHASVYGLFLPAGINVQLIKTALWLTLGAVLVFYTALLHTLHARRYGRRSRLLVIAVALGTVFAIFDRRTSFRPPDLAPPRLVAVEPAEAPHLVVLALPGATLDALLPLAEQGKLANLALLLDEGAAARLQGFTPVRRPALWASWATAKLPFRHGISGEAVYAAPRLGFGRPLRLLPLAVGFERWGLAGGEARPLGIAERDALPVWEILARAGRRSAALGFAPALAGGTETLRMAPDPPRPAAAERALSESRWPELARALADDRRRIAALLARLASSAAPGAYFVQLDGLEAASLATFGGYVRAEFEGSRAGEARRAADALAAYLAGLDAEIGQLWESLRPPRLLVVSSAYGVGAPTGVGRFLRDLTGGRRVEGVLAGPPDGVLLLRGDGVRRGVHLPDARILDVAPTLLYALGLPIARDFDGRVLSEAFEPALLQRRALDFVPSFEGLPRRADADAVGSSPTLPPPAP